MNIRNKDGAILVVSVGFVIVFTMLGIAAIYFAGMQNEWAEKQKNSTQAFWLADAALERAREALPGLFDKDDPKNKDILLANGKYDVSSEAIGKYQWKVITKALVNGEIRSIEAILQTFDVEHIITSKGPLTISEDIAIDDSKPIVQDYPFTFESIFNGHTEKEILTLANQTYVDPKVGAIGEVQGITVIKMVDQGVLQVPSDNFKKNNLLVIDTSESKNEHPEIHFKGNAFDGIVWVKGKAQITGEPAISGAMFFDSKEGVKLSGQGEISYSIKSVEGAISNLGPPGKPKIIRFKEI